MRLQFPNTTRTKKAAKHLATALRVSLSSAQRAIARSCGYRDWHELEGEVAAGPPCPLDQELTIEEFVARQRALILKIADDLGAFDGDVQYALSSARLAGDRPASLEEQIAMRVACWRANDLGLTGGRESGAVGVLKSPGRNGEVVILRAFGQPTQVVTHGGILTIGDHEFVAPRQARDLFVPMRLFLPYGCWTEADGAKVLFSRDYHPLWRLRDGKAPERIEPWTRIKFVDQTWPWGEAIAPWDEPEIETKLIEFLKTRGLYRLPILADALPLLVRSASASAMPESAELLRVHRMKLVPGPTTQMRDGTAPELSFIGAL